MAGQSQPLAKQFEIVDEQGRPTDYFIRWAQQRQIDIGEGITAEQALAIVEDYVEDWSADRDIIAGVALDGGGPLNADVTIDHANSIVTPGTYGDATHSPQLTVDQQGHVTAVTNVPISGGGGGGGGFTLSGMLDANFNPQNRATFGTVFVVGEQGLTITGAGIVMTTVTGGQYRIGVAPYISGTSVMTAPPVYTATFTAATGRNTVIFLPLASSVVLTPLTAFIIFVTRIDSTPTVSQSIATFSGGVTSPGIWLPAQATNRGRLLSSVNPLITDVWAVVANNYGFTCSYTVP